MIKMLNLSFAPFQCISTERLFLRQVEEKDVEEIFFLRSNPKVLKYLDWAPASSQKDAIEFIEKINDLEKNNEAVTWAITLKNDPKLIGTICYWNIQKEHYRAELGYVLHPDFQGKGVMQEATKEVVKFGFQIMKLQTFASVPFVIAICVSNTLFLIS